MLLLRIFPLHFFADGNLNDHLFLRTLDLFNLCCHTTVFFIMNLVDVVPGVQEQVLGDERSDADHRSDNEPEEVHAVDAERQKTKNQLFEQSAISL